MTTQRWALKVAGLFRGWIPDKQEPCSAGPFQAATVGCGCCILLGPVPSAELSLREAAFSGERVCCGTVLGC